MAYIFADAIFSEGFISSLAGNVFRGVLPLVALAVIFGVAIKITTIRRRKQAAAGTGKLLSDDYYANLARTKEIEQERFYVADVGLLPIRQYSDASEVLAQRQKKAVDLADKKMINRISGLSNVDLKNMFGVAQLDKIAMYEENFTKYMHALRFWCERLIEEGQAGDARIILEESVKAGSEVSAIYTMLAGIYRDDKNEGALAGLWKNLDEGADWPGRKIALNEIDKIMARVD
ncbi:MAG: hypothetical protein FWB71_00865 [Defluviitaleaceae bacterium]|nr:hypothetical protein [Defluviitaleaceae bacterium]